MEAYILVSVLLVCCGIGVALGWQISSRAAHGKMVAAKDQAKKILGEAERDADALKREKLIEVKDEWYSKKKEFDGDIQSKRNKFQAQEKQLDIREENIDRKVELLGKKEREQGIFKKDLETLKRTLDTGQKELEAMLAEENVRLEIGRASCRERV